MNILVTGGAGFIGSHLANALLSQGHQVTVVDNLSTGSRANVPSAATFLELDLAEARTYKSLPIAIDMVYHLASQVSSEISSEDPVHDLKSNSLATLSLLQWAKMHSVKKFVFTSTMGVYADRLGHAATETSMVRPKSFYGINKQASEGFLRIFSEEGMRTTVLRLFNVYGPGQNMANLKQGMLSIYMAFILKNVPIAVKGPLDRVRDFVYVDDVVTALILAQSELADGKTYNVCTGRKFTVAEAINSILDAFGLARSYPIEILPRTPRDIDSCWGDCAAISREMGWEPRFALEEGLQRMVAWLRTGLNK